MITSNYIRLDINDYKFSKFLDLLDNLHERKNELQGGRYIDMNRQRKIVAEEMSKLGITIPSKHKGKKPNRAFLDISYKINPSICSDEIERREKVKLYKGIESDKKIEIENSVNKLKEIKKKYIE